MKVFSASANLTQDGFRLLTECMYSDETFIEIDILLQEDGAYTVFGRGPHGQETSGRSFGLEPSPGLGRLFAFGDPVVRLPGL